MPNEEVKKGEREKVEKKLSNEEFVLVLLLLLLSIGVVWFLNLSTFLTKKKNQLTNSNFGEYSQFSYVSKKNEREEVEKKLSNEYEPPFIPKGLWPFNILVNRYIFI